MESVLPEDHPEGQAENESAGRPWATVGFVAGVAFVYGMLQQPDYIRMSHRIVSGLVVAVMLIVYATVIAFIARLFKARWRKAFGWAFAALMVFSIYGDIQKPNIDRPVYIGECEIKCWNE